MNKLSGIGFISAVAGSVLLIFKLIAAATAINFTIADLSLSQLMSTDNIDKINNITNSFLQSCAENVINTPLYLHLIIGGIMILLISGLSSK